LKTLIVKPGQIVLLTTDGIFEAHNPAGEMFGKDRFKAFYATLEFI